VAYGLGGERQRQQVIEVAPGGAVTQVFAVQLYLVQVEKSAGLLQQRAVQWVRATQ
jgi:hypothetical protein